jgi:hypothetical protein
LGHRLVFAEIAETNLPLIGNPGYSDFGSALDQTTRDQGQIDVIICRTHLAAFFWHLEHLFEVFRTAITRGQKEHPELRYFWGYEKRLEEIEQYTMRKEIDDYRNMAHETPGIIGCAWDSEHLFHHHFLPTIKGHQPREDVEMNVGLQQYFEFAANVWLDFVPGDFKEKFPRDFRFPVTVPYLYGGTLPSGLEGVPQLEVSVVSYNKERSAEAVKDAEGR